MLPDPCLAGVRATIATHRLLPRGSRVVVAVSGGPDSVALLHVLRALQPTLKLSLHVAHLDHGLRPESGQDADFVRALAQRWRLPVTIERREVGAWCKHHGLSLEDGARRIRYAFLLEAARRHSTGRIATAHTADDQAETVLMRLLRGTGLTGLGGIPVARQLEDCWVIRPLLETWRSEVLALLRQAGLPFREDSSNADRRFLRNRIRHELLPLLEREYHPDIRQALVQLAEQCRTDAAYLERSVRRHWRRVVREPRPAGTEAPELAISIARFTRQPPAVQRQLLRQAVRQIRTEGGQWEFRHWRQAERLFTDQPSGTILDLPGGVQLVRRNGQVICRLRSPARSGYTG